MCPPRSAVKTTPPAVGVTPARTGFFAASFQRTRPDSASTAVIHPRDESAGSATRPPPASGPPALAPPPGRTGGGAAAPATFLAHPLTARLRQREGILAQLDRN